MQVRAHNPNPKPANNTYPQLLIREDQDLIVLAIEPSERVASFLGIVIEPGTSPHKTGFVNHMFGNSFFKPYDGTVELVNDAITQWK